MEKKSANGKYHQSNLQTEGIRDVIDSLIDADGVLVEVDHPILELLQSAGRFDPIKARYWVRLDRELVQASCTALINDGFGLVRIPETGSTSGP